ncbi:response regulator transcription factor [Thauera sp.]|uniref:response regulator transcription factor n=1 Tax=Thauera sp. TaxID=1905334 RepID=UPI0039E3E967
MFRVKLHLPRVARPKLALRPEREIRGYAGRRRCLLVVDDQPGQSRLIADMLRPRGFLVHECRHPDEVPGLLGSLQPDLVFLDVSMPALDGWTLCRRLRDAGHGMPIVMVSANAYENLPQRREAAGCDDFIVKPVLETELFARLSAWLGLSWTYAEAQPAEDAGVGGGQAMSVPGPVPHALQQGGEEGWNALPAAARLPAAMPDPGLAGLSARVRAELRDFADLGHLQGLIRRLDELEVLHPELQVPLAALREMTMALRFDSLLRVLDEAADD